MKLETYKKFVFASLFILGLTFSCTDLEIEETDSLISEETGDVGFSGVTNPSSALNDLYNKVGGDFATQENMYALSEVTSDELLVPTRGTDWGDNGVWRQLHTHTWTPDHAFVKNAWNNLNQNIFRSSEIIETTSADASTVAQAKFLRAFNMFFVMDLFGSVPFRGVDEGPDINPTVLTRPEAYSFIETDLTDAIAALPSVGPGVENVGSASQEAAKFLLAKLYLNGHVYKGTGTADNADMQNVIDLVDEISASGFAVQEGYFQIFEPTDDSETILFLRSDLGARIWNSLHYNQNSPDNTGGGWNGFSTLAEFYDLFEGDPNTNYVGDGQEERRGYVPDAATANSDNLGIGYGFLIDLQYNEDGTPLTNRQNQPLVFQKEFPSLVGNGEAEGVRVIKYHPYDPTDEDDQVNSYRQHQIIFRYADAHLMKAEAMMRMGGNPTAMVNELRSLREDTPDLGSVDEQALLDERARELFIEFWRRNDLVRFGQFSAPWGLKEISGDDNVNLFPIPATALLSNPNLVQNPGY